jgi:homoserine/homoserine lactone efflux protein
MTLDIYGLFVATSVLLALTPGPNMALFVANGAAHGATAARATVAGNILGLSILVTITALGMSWLVAVMAEWFDVLRWLGAIYLIWLGYRSLRRALRMSDEMLDVTPASNGRCFRQGLIVSLSNPKVLLFLSAFFPQFIRPGDGVEEQLALLAVTFVATLGLVDMGLASAIGSARVWFSGRRRRSAEGISGALLVCGGLWLAATRRTV